MRDAIKTLYEHWINVHTTTVAEQSAFEAINKAAKGQAEHDPLYTARAIQGESCFATPLLS